MENVLLEQAVRIRFEDPIAEKFVELTVQNERLKNAALLLKAQVELTARHLEGLPSSNDEFKGAILSRLLKTADELERALLPIPRLEVEKQAAQILQPFGKRPF